MLLVTFQVRQTRRPRTRLRQVTPAQPALRNRLLALAHYLAGHQIEWAGRQGCDPYELLDLVPEVIRQPLRRFGDSSPGLSWNVTTSDSFGGVCDGPHVSGGIGLQR